MIIATARDKIDLLFGEPMNTIAQCSRGFLIAKPGHIFIACDFAQIEARVLAWAAGQEDVVLIFRSGGKIYEVQAGQIYSVEVEQVLPDQRQVGKAAILGLGFQGGVGAFRMMAKTYGVRLTPAFPTIWASAPLPRRVRAEENYKKRLPSMRSISREEYIAADLVKLAYRESNPHIVAYWYAVDDAARNAINNPGEKFSAGAKGREVTYLVKGSFLFCRLPSGRALSYPFPKIVTKKNKFGELQGVITYMAVDSLTNKWERTDTYGGSLVENIVQGIARDLLANAMLKVEEAGYPIVIHVHDELVVEAPPEFGLQEKIEELTCDLPEWAVGLPLEAKAWTGPRYKKD